MSSFAKPFLVFVLTVIVLSMLLGLMGLFLGWFHTGTQVVGPANVKRQWRKVYDLYESMEKGARQVCDAQEALEQSAASVTEQRRSQVMAYKQAYYAAQKQYNAAVDNFFEAGLVKPPDLPGRAPELESMMVQVCR
jgi:hypothetical protein